jgi:hypothetical protein
MLLLPAFESGENFIEVAITTFILLMGSLVAFPFEEPVLFLGQLVEEGL